MYTIEVMTKGGGLITVAFPKNPESKLEFGGARPMRLWSDAGTNHSLAIPEEEIVSVHGYPKPGPIRGYPKPGPDEEDD